MPAGGSSPLTSVAIDATEGARGLQAVIEGAAQASLDDDATRPIEVILVGDERKLTEMLNQLRHNPERLSVVHSESPNPMVDAVRLVADGRAAAMVSTGATTALVEACATLLKPLPGVGRPALSAVYPTAQRHGQREDPFSLVLDVGATLDASTDDLVTFAYLGAAYARAVSQNSSPRVALLAAGSEPNEAPAEVAAAAERLARARGLAYVGLLEAVDIPKGFADVVVCDGFAGKTVIKLLDGVRELVLDLAGYAQKQRLLWKLGVSMLSGALSRVKVLTDWEQYGGAPLLGYQQTILRAHPQSGPRAIHNACRLAAKVVAADVPSRFIEVVERADAETTKTATA